MTSDWKWKHFWETYGHIWRHIRVPPSKKFPTLYEHHQNQKPKNFEECRYVPYGHQTWSLQQYAFKDKNFHKISNHPPQVILEIIDKIWTTVFLQKPWNYVIEIETLLFYSNLHKMYRDTWPVSFIQFGGEIEILEILLEPDFKKAKTLALRWGTSFDLTDPESSAFCSYGQSLSPPPSPFRSILIDPP